MVQIKIKKSYIYKESMYSKLKSIILLVLVTCSTLTDFTNAIPQRMANLERNMKHHGGLGLESTCANGVGTDCGVFEIPPNLVLNTAKNNIQPIYKTGYFTFPVFDPNGVPIPTEVLDGYGIPLDYPPTRDGLGAQTGFGLIFPVTARTARQSPLETFRGISAEYLKAKGIPLPDAMTREIASNPTGQPWPLITYLNGLGQYSGQELIGFFIGLASQGSVVFSTQQSG